MSGATPKPRGFAAMSKAKRLEASRKGGAGAAAEDRTFAKRPDLAVEAGRIGGQKKPGTKR